MRENGNKHGAASGYKNSWGTGPMRDLSPHGGLLRIANPYNRIRRMTYPPKLTIC